jgi:hypothetical protein
MGLNDMNSWQRVLLLFSAIYACFVLVMYVISLPKPEKTPHEIAFYQELSEESLNALYPPEQGNVPPAATVADGAKTTGIKMPNGHLLLFPIGTPSSIQKKVAQEYWGVVKYEVNRKRIFFAMSSLFMWAIPCVGLYLLGTVLGWVYSAFRK